MARNLVVFCDGTGQEGGRGHDTNIYRIFNMIEDRTERQISFYDPGLGTGFHKLTGNVSGFGITKNIMQCYRFIFENYEVGSKIYLFGFSRGAATVRSLTSMIHHFGILPKSRPELIEEIYKIYRIGNHDKRQEKIEAFNKEHHRIWARVHFLGCFDTVAALGFPLKWVSAILNLFPFFKHKFHNFTLSESVLNAYQALAIDDERLTFHPVLWDKTSRPDQVMEQVWFAGMHTDVGGGYVEHELSDIPLVWMVNKAVQRGLLIYKRNTKEDQVDEHACGVMHDSRKGLIGSIYRRKQRSWPKHMDGVEPVVHESVIARHNEAPQKDCPAYDPWILKGAYTTEPWVKHKDYKW